MEQRDIAANRTEALVSGAPFYIGAKPCGRGHDPAIRRTGSKACYECGLSYSRDKRANDTTYRDSERIRKRGQSRRMKERGTFNYEAKRKDDKAYKARKRIALRQSPEAIAAREAKAIARHEAREAKARDKANKEAARLVWAQGKHERQVQHNRNKARQRRALKRGASGKVTNATLASMRDNQGHQCAYCGAEAEHLDHMTSVANGGQHEADNLQWLCAPCNMRKRATNDSDYRAKHGIAAITPWDNMAGRAVWLGIVAY